MYLPVNFKFSKIKTKTKYRQYIRTYIRYVRILIYDEVIYILISYIRIRYESGSVILVITLFVNLTKINLFSLNY